MKPKWILPMTAVLVLLAVHGLSGQETGPQTGRLKVQVKQYRRLAAEDVYQAAREGIEADVRFRDAYRGRTSLARGFRQVQVGGRRYRPVLAFRTASDMTVLVPWSSQEALHRLLGVPQQQALTQRELRRDIRLNQGQQVTVLGTVLGTARGQKVVLADAVSAGELALPTGDREVHVFWPTQAEPRIIEETTTRTLEFPCTNVQGETVSPRFAVGEVEWSRLLELMAGLQAEMEGRQGRKSYGEYDPLTVYRYARAGDRVTVDFTSAVRRVFARPLPGALRSVSVPRGGRPTNMPVVTALELTNGTVVLVPDTWPTVVQHAAATVPGESVRVRGTVLGERGAYAVVLADMLYFPGRHPEEETTTWVVNVEWPNARRPLIFWDQGQYAVRGLPCVYAQGRNESFRLLISRFRTIEVPPPPGGMQF